MLVAIYCRISTDEDLQRYSLGNQELALRTHADRKGWSVSAVYIDKTSGSKQSRPGLNALLDSLSEGHAEAVLVTEQDRLSRLDEIGWAVLKQAFRQTNTKLFTLSGAVDFGNEDQEFTADVLALLDRRRRKTIVRQMVRGRAGAIRRGEWLGRSPFGYRRDPATKHLVPVPEEAVVIREIFAAYAQGEQGSAKIAVAVRNLLGRPVGGDFVLDIIRNQVYRGDVVMEIGGERLEALGAHEPIVSHELWDRCNRILRTRAATYKRADLTSKRGLATGLLFCYDCLHRLTPAMAVKHLADGPRFYRYYRHRRPESGTFPGARPCRAAHRLEIVDEVVRRGLVALAVSEPVARELWRLAASDPERDRLTGEIRAAKTRLTAIRSRQKRLLRLFLNGSWDPEELAAERERLELTKEKAAAELSALLERREATRYEFNRQALVAEALAAALTVEAWPHEQQQRLLWALVDRIEITPEGRVALTPRPPFVPGFAPTGPQAG